VTLSATIADAALDDLPRGLLDAITGRPTPYYVFDLERVERRARAFRSGAETVFPSASFAYPYKVNPIGAIAQRAVDVYGGAEAATFEELSLATAAGADARRCLFGGIAKRTSSLCAAAQAGVTIKIDSAAELQRLRGAWSELDHLDELQLLLRIALPEGDGWSRFGLLQSEACDAIAAAEPWTRRLRGLHFHAGTSLPDPALHEAAVAHCVPVLDALAVAGVARPFLDIGGGYPNCPDADVRDTAAVFVGAVAARLEQSGRLTDDVQLVCEPGRITVERAGYLVASVLESSVRAASDAVVIDAGSTLAGGSWAPVRSARSIVFAGHDLDIGAATCHVFGNLCHEGDLVASDAVVVRDGSLDDVAVIGDVGGYRLSAAAAWMQQLPPVYELRDGTLVQLRRELPLRDFS